jgi:hypothetical protein
MRETETLAHTHIHTHTHTHTYTLIHTQSTTQRKHRRDWRRKNTYMRLTFTLDALWLEAGVEVRVAVTGVAASVVGVSVGITCT